MVKDFTPHTLQSLLDELKRDALHSGRYDPPYTPEHYDNRDTSKAFRCMMYNRRVRQVNALTKVMKGDQNGRIQCDLCGK